MNKPQFREPTQKPTAFRHAAVRLFPAAETICSFRTSGTTGVGYGKHHFRTLELYRAAAIGSWQRMGLPTKNLFCLMPPPEVSSFLIMLHGRRARSSTALFSRDQYREL